MNVVSYPHVGNDPEMCKHPVYLNAKLESYIATPLYVNDKPFGTLNFSDTKIREEGFNDYHIELIILMGAALGAAIEYFNQIEENSIIFENISDALIIADSNRRITRVNSAFKEVFGYNFEDIQGKLTSCLYENEEEFQRQGRLRCNLNAEELLKPYIVNYKKKDGTVFPGETLGRKTTTGDGSVMMLGTVRDVSERLQVEKMKNEFVATMNHELRTPLTSIKGSIALLSDLASDKLDEDERELLEVSKKNSDVLLQLINDLLDFEKFNSESYNIQKRFINLKSIIDNACKSLSGYLELHGSSIEVQEIADDIEINADEKRLYQVLFNLLSNAIKFSPQASVIKITHKVLSDGIEVSITDTGLGIPPEKLDYIFEAFTQIDSTDSRNQSGTGLGLAICKKNHRFT